MAKGTTEGLKNWLGGEKTARPANVGPHDYRKDQHDPEKRGVTPEDYRPRPGDDNNRTDPQAPGGPVNIPAKRAEPAANRPAGQNPGQAHGKQDSGSLPEE